MVCNFHPRGLPLVDHTKQRERESMFDCNSEGVVSATDVSVFMLHVFKNGKYLRYLKENLC